MALFNRVVGELAIGDRRLSRYGYISALKETTEVVSAVGQGFLHVMPEPNTNSTDDAVTPEEVGLLNASLPVPMAHLACLALGSNVLVGFGQTGGRDSLTFINQLYSFDGAAFVQQLTRSTDVLDGPSLLGVSVSEVGVIS